MKLVIKEVTYKFEVERAREEVRPATDLNEEGCENIPFYQDVLDGLEKIISDKMTAEEINHIPWFMIPEVTLRYVIVKNKFYNLNNAAMINIMKTLVGNNIFHFKDFEEMVNDWENVDYRLTGMVRDKVLEVGHYFNRAEEAEALSDKIVNKGCPSYMCTHAQSETGF